MLARQALRPGVPLTLAAASAVGWLGGPWNALALTVTAGVGIINAFLLEGLFGRMLQPGTSHLTRGVVGLAVARLALWGGLFVGWYLMRRRIELWAVAVGVACFLVAMSFASAGSAGDGSGRVGAGAP
jgi:hypothetical protein